MPGGAGAALEGGRVDRRRLARTHHHRLGDIGDSALRGEELEGLNLEAIAAAMAARGELVPAYIVLDWLRGAGQITPQRKGLLDAIADQLLQHNPGLKAKRRLFYTRRHSRASLDARLLSVLMAAVADEASQILGRLINRLDDPDLRLPLLMSWAARWGEQEQWQGWMNQFFSIHGLRGCWVVNAAELAADSLGHHILHRVDMLSAAEADPRGRDELVSIVMPAFNAAASVKQAIRSVLRQTHTSFELLVVDDASSDATALIVSEMAAHDPRIQLVVLPDNSGAFVARNVGLLMARGAFITTHDADDISHPQRLRLQLEALRRQQELMAVIGQWLRVGPRGEVMYHNKRGGGFLHGALATMMVRKEVISKIGYYDNVRYSADTEFLFRIRRRFGWDSVSTLQAPVALAASRQGSLTTDPSTATDSFVGDCATRAAYRSAWESWHASHEPDKLHLPLRSDPRVFPAPEAMAVEHDYGVDPCAGGAAG